MVEERLDLNRLDALIIISILPRRVAEVGAGLNEVPGVCLTGDPAQERSLE